MGKNKENFMDDAFFNKYFTLDGDNVGSHETEEAIKKCYPIRQLWQPPAQKFIPQTAHEKETYDYLKLTNEEKAAKENEHLLKNYGFTF